MRAHLLLTHTPETPCWQLYAGVQGPNGPVCVAGLHVPGVCEGNPVGHAHRTSHSTNFRPRNQNTRLRVRDARPWHLLRSSGRIVFPAAPLLGFTRLLCFLLWCCAYFSQRHETGRKRTLFARICAIYSFVTPSARPVVDVCASLPLFLHHFSPYYCCGSSQHTSFCIVYLCFRTVSPQKPSGGGHIRVRWPSSGSTALAPQRWHDVCTRTTRVSTRPRAHTQTGCQSFWWSSTAHRLCPARPPQTTAISTRQVPCAVRQ